MELILATQNQHKIREIKQILRGLPVKIYSMLDFDKVPDVKESGKTFKENSIKKAGAFANSFSMPALADDSGLEIKALKGAPGIRSARFAGPDSTKEKLCKKVLKLMKNVPSSNRSARFVCSIAFVTTAGEVWVAEGCVYGRIGFEMSGGNGFGYDPIFIPRGYKKTFAQMNALTKNRLSHRARALYKMRNILIKSVII